MRLFVAIPLPDEIKKKMQQLQQPFPGIRWQPPGQMHITLRFLGETSADKTKMIKKQLSQIKAESFSLMVKGLGTFPSRKQPKIIWVGVEKSDPLTQLQKAVEKICADNGFKPEKRKYIPHITLGRVKSASPKKIRQWISNHENWGTENFLSKRFALFESRQESGGVTHEVIKKYPLLS